MATGKKITKKKVGRPKKAIKKAIKKAVKKTPKRKLSTESTKKPTKKPTKKTSTESKKEPSKRSPGKSSEKTSKKVASRSKAGAKDSRKDSRKDSQKNTRKKTNELAAALDEVKSNKGKRKKKVQEHKRLGYRENMKWIGVDKDGNELEVRQEEGEVTDEKSGKVLGYCPKCKFLIASCDLESPCIFVCSSCGKRARTNKLRKELEKKPEYKSKKEYFAATINTKSIDMPAHMTHAPEFKKKI